MSLNDNPVGSLGVGRAEVQEDDVAVPLSSSPVSCAWVMIYANNSVAVGGPNVARESEEAETKLKGIKLSSEDTVTLPINDLSAVYINGGDEDSVSFIYGVA